MIKTFSHFLRKQASILFTIILLACSATGMSSTLEYDNYLERMKDILYENGYLTDEEYSKLNGKEQKEDFSAMSNKNVKQEYWSPWSALPLEHRYRFSPHRIEFPTELIFEFHDFCTQTMEVRLKSYNKDENNFVCACVMDNFRLFNTDAEYEVERMKEIKGSKWEHVKRGPDDPSPVPLFAKYWYKCLLKREEILSKIGGN